MEKIDEKIASLLKPKTVEQYWSGTEYVFVRSARKPKELLLEMGAKRYVNEEGCTDNINPNSYVCEFEEGIKLGDVYSDGQIIVHIYLSSGSGWFTAKQIIYTLPEAEIESYIQELEALEPTTYYD